MAYGRQLGAGGGLKNARREKFAPQFLIDTLPIRITRNSFSCSIGTHSNRHSPAPLSVHILGLTRTGHGGIQPSRMPFTTPMKNPVVRQLAFALLLFAIGLGVAALPARAQDPGPMTPPPKFEVNRIPAVPHPGPPPIPVEQIIQRFAASEDVAQKIYSTYDFSQTIRVEEMNNTDGSAGAGGKLVATGDDYVRPDGQRFWRATKPTESSLKGTPMMLDDLHPVMTLPLFFLTTAETGNYNFLYAGQDKLDDLNTYVFQVKPKQVSRARLYFEGAIWVDDHDLAIVKTFGKFVSETSDNSTGLPFSMFEMYRENFQQKYWLPTYIVSDGYVNPGKDDELHLKLVLRSSGFKLNSLATPAPARATNSSAAAASSAPAPIALPGDIPPGQSPTQPAGDAPSDSIHKRIN
jgi:hypothetical protein